MIYLSVFLASIILFWIAENSDTPPIVKKTICFIGMLVPSILAAFRSTSVGTDTGGYVYYFQYISKLSLPSVFTDLYLSRLHLEYGFRFFDFVLSRFTTDPRWMLFFVAFLTIFFVFIGARRYSDRYPTWLIMSCYLFLHYCNYLNVARQGLAVAIVFSGFRYLEEKKYKTFIIWGVIATSIHSVSAIATVILLVVYLYTANKEAEVRRNIIIVLGATVVLWVYRYLIELFLVLFPFYRNYIETYSGGTAFSLAAILIRIPFIVIAYALNKRICSYNKVYNTYCLFLIIDLIISQFGALYGPFARIAWFFSYYKLLIIPEIYMYYKIHSYKNREGNTVIILCLIFLGLIGYWIYFTVYNHYGFSLPVYPYSTQGLSPFHIM